MKKDKHLKIKEKICDTLEENPYMKIKDLLDDIKLISSFQLQRLKDEKIIDKKLALRQAIHILIDKSLKLLDEIR